METRAPYALIGLFVLAAIGAVFGFVYWLNNVGGLGERLAYRVRFENSVSGMLVGAAVLFNGIRVGEVTDLKLDPDSPKRVLATIAVAPATPIRADTKAGIDFQGLTGVAVVTLQGGDPATPALARPSGTTPVIEADPLAWQNMTQAARNVLQRFDAILADNADNLKSTIANITTFSEALARNSQKVDGIVAGLERMTGGGAAAAPNVMYDLAAPRSFPRLDQTVDAQLVVNDPAAVLLFDTQKVLVRPNVPDNPTFENARWSDSLPKLIQAKVVQAFENAKYFSAVSRPTDGANADYQLLIEIRAFDIETAPRTEAVVDLSAKVLGSNGRVVGTNIFRAASPTTVSDASSAAAVLNQAFGQVTTELVAWTAKIAKT
jgi:phospholipid/cholesterol/gamma-HCH transport system substrate-binding protein